MMRTRFVFSLLVMGLLSASGILAAGSSAAIAMPAGQVTAALAAPFIGDWTLTLQGPNGPGTFALSLKVEQEKVTGEISSEQLPKQPITHCGTSACS